MACILTIFKNETTAMDEWLQHHLSQGVSHVFMIDNGSTDDFMPIIKKYEKYITLYTMLDQGVQATHYNSVLPDIKKSGYKWCCVMDLDEFMVFEDPTLTIPGFCEKYFVGNIVELAIQWKIFGSNGHIQQPQSIRCGFTECNPIPCSHKYICLIDKVISLDVHVSVHDGERILVKDALLYHYCIQSWEWFTNVKMTRGDVNGYVNVRNQQYFNNWNATATATDVLLKDRVLSGMYSFTA